MRQWHQNSWVKFQILINVNLKLSYQSTTSFSNFNRILSEIELNVCDKFKNFVLGKQLKKAADAEVSKLQKNKSWKKNTGAAYKDAKKKFEENQIFLEKYNLKKKY